MKHTPRIFDCFPFFNEIELLELRLEQHYDHVDFFVLAEATHTFSGLPKPLHFEEHAERFDRFADKIIHVVIDDDIDTRNGWARENFQRD
ncbi:MAG: N-acetylglucosaminyltransferase, partial [Pseudomonadota bacterium]